MIHGPATLYLDSLTESIGLLLLVANSFALYVLLAVEKKGGTLDCSTCDAIVNYGK